ncbi:hypothetical protein SORBI_3001G480200 [Sorghum bicolor]|uniref:Uncharacterized protein n=1 Tax=Sorghum bicolor TaxID=4558 RepID=A0A1Z5SB81_SORBI|nr:hypothetical protein SORBI_3001G480200 [Sorghum bicolor]
MVSSEEDGCLAFEKTPFEKKPGQPGARKRKSGSKLGSKEFRQFWKLAEQSPMDPFTGTEVVYHHRNDWAKKGFPDVCSAMSTGHSTTPRGAVPAENGTATSNGSSISVKSSKRAANTLGSGDDNPNDEEGRKCLEGSHSRPRVQRVKIGRREQLDNLNPVDVILVLDESSPVEEWSQILRAGQARNFQFVKNRRYYEAVYHCICRNSEAQEAAPAVQQHGPELPSQPLDDDSEALENEQDAEEDQEGTHFFLEHGQQQLSPAEADLADLLPEEGMEPVDDDGEAMEKEKDADYSPSSSSGLKEDNDEWLQFPYFFEENIVENLDIPAINVDEEEEVPEDDTSDEEGPNTDPDDDDEHFLSDEEGSDRDSSPSDDEDESDDWIQFPFFFFEEEEMEQHHDADYSPSSSSGSEEDNDEWLQFPYFFEENIVENLDIPAINVDEEEEVPEDDTSDEEGPNTDHDDDDEHFLSDEEGSDRDFSPSDAEDEGDDWLQFPFFFEEENNLDLPASDREEEMPMPAVEQPNHEFDGQEEHDEQWMLFPEQSSESEEESMTLEETSDEEDEHNSDPDYALTEEEDPSADEAEWWSNTDFMDDLYSESESDIDDMGKDPDYYPSSGSGDGE